MRIRYEAFGGIIALDRPAATLYVDQDYLRGLGCAESPLWLEGNKVLSAPVTAHFAVTNRCPLGCQTCYSASGRSLPAELSTAEAKSIIEQLAEMQVFTIAFGGGEPLARADLFELAAFARQRGITPTMTTNGFYIDEEMAHSCRVFSHIHVSLDGIGETYRAVRGVDGFRFADRAIRLLRRQRLSVGVNCVVTRQNFDHLEEVARFLRRRGVRDVLFLRLKPAGRATADYQARKLTPEQARAFYPLFQRLTRKYRLLAHVDCAMLPFFYYHRPPENLLRLTGGEGCHGASEIVEITPQGRVKGCSFAAATVGPASELPSFWQDAPLFARYRNWDVRPPEPCRSCDYLALCRGGCHAVAQAVSGDFNAPDPECPFVEGVNSHEERKSA